MKKTIIILILSVFITALAAACGEQEIMLRDVSAQTPAGADDETATGALTEGTGMSGTTVGTIDIVSVEADAAMTAASTAEETGDIASVCVYVCGEVVVPGVYELTAGARIYEAVQLAGGLTPDADDAAINLAEPATDGMMIRIPAEGSEEAIEAEAAYTTGAQAAAAGGQALVNINTADAAALETLPGIGESKAAAIIAYRQEHGRFAGIEELKNVSGIGDSTYERLSSLITVTP